jgi:hypothetical protein
MSALIDFTLRVDKFPGEKYIKGKDGAVYLKLTMSINDETRYGNNTSVYVAQDKEEREAKKQRQYLGNGKVFWNNGVISNAEKQEPQDEPVTATEKADLPF